MEVRPNELGPVSLEIRLLNQVLQQDAEELYRYRDELEGTIERTRQALYPQTSTTIS
jgi:hypothetical protein